jgi:C4-dicarboxylate-specific signal transduction histidine kinase
MSESPSLMLRLMEIARISALAEFGSGFAHEINQPLGAIATYAKAGERMLDRPAPLIAETIEVLRQINHEALSAGEGIRRIRALYIQDESTRSPCLIPELIQELRPVLETYARQVRGVLRVESADSLPAVSADRLRIQHVILALVQNACDASVEATEAPDITISTTSDRYAVETSVIDSGQGVPHDVQEQLFHAFVTTKRYGSGLGLASSKAIIESHQGTIGFVNLSTGGSRFWFRLPIAERQL